MHTQISNMHCPHCEKNVKAERNKPSIAFGIATGGLNHAVVDKAWHCSECGMRLGLLTSIIFSLGKSTREKKEKEKQDAKEPHF